MSPLNYCYLQSFPIIIYTSIVVVLKWNGIEKHTMSSKSHYLMYVYTLWTLFSGMSLGVLKYFFKTYFYFTLSIKGLTKSQILFRVVHSAFDTQ